jgi:hypothetical protein
MPAITLQRARRVDVLRQKLDRGGISTDDADDITDKGRAAEAHLIAETHKHPERSVNMIRQLEAMVLGECREAYLRTSQKGELFGVPMLIDVQNRLRKLATERPLMVANQEYECLLGMAGMLTEECRIWWSKRFPIQENV